jgi:hypothetical protein
MSNGVPPLLATIQAVQSEIIIAQADSVIVARGMNNEQWGIYYQGYPVVVADSVISLEYRQDWRIVDYPMEQGAFQSYNKVQMPFTERIRLVKGGSDWDRQNFLNQIAAAAASLNLYEVITPDSYYSNVNIHHYEYRRTATEGKTLLAVDIWVTEIRQTVVPAYMNTASPSGQDPVQTGAVQPQTPVTPSQQSWATLVNLIT